MKSVLKRMNYSSILMNLIIFTVIYCKTVQFATVNQIEFATVNLNYSNLLATPFEMSNSVEMHTGLEQCKGE